MLSARLLTLNLPIPLLHQLFLQNEWTFHQDELTRIEAELAQFLKASAGDTSREKMYLVYDVRPMRLLRVCVFVMLVCFCTSALATKRVCGRR